MILLFFCVYQLIDSFVMDALELYFGNELVFEVHNYCDSLMKYFYAGLSGLICAWPLLIVFGLKYVLYKCLRRRKSTIFTQAHYVMMGVISLAKFLVNYTYDKSGNCFRNHIYFYYIHTTAEVCSITLILVVGCKCFTKKSKYCTPCVIITVILIAIIIVGCGLGSALMYYALRII